MPRGTSLSPRVTRWLLTTPLPGDVPLASFLLREGKPEDSSLATLTGPAVDVVPYQEDEEPETDEEDEADADE